MQVSVVRTGGFAGLSEEIAGIDTAQLEPAAARQVEALIESSNFYALPNLIEDDAVGADLYRYEVTVRDGTREHKVAFTDGSSAQTANLRKLVETLSR